jgi:transcriptional regulator with GAF, ATPase, and Fis domain
MKELIKELVVSLQAECGCIMLYDSNENLLYCAAEHNLPENWKHLTNYPDETSMNGLVYSSGEPLIKNNLLLNLSGHEVKSVLIIPIEKDLEIIGTIEVVNKKNGLFDKKDRDKAAEVAARTADSM